MGLRMLCIFERMIELIQNMMSAGVHVNVNPMNCVIKTAENGRFTLAEFNENNLFYMGQHEDETMANTMQYYVEALCFLFIHLLLGQVMVFGVWYNFGFDPLHHIPADLSFLCDGISASPSKRPSLDKLRRNVNECTDATRKQLKEANAGRTNVPRNSKSKKKK